ncbi:MAG: hypothetical protein JXM79_24825 [Sedimentisphaerales bacterium]|nr:hypothetical protein [Sedimentisphaerales bacterium]
MMAKTSIIIPILLLTFSPAFIEARTNPEQTPEFDVQIALELKLGEPTGQLRAVPVHLGKGQPRAILAVHCPDAEVDPYVEMFFFPKDTLKLTLFDEKGKILWRRDLGRGVIPGIWFTPVYPFDLDGDGVDEIWFVNNLDADHPLSINNLRLERIDARTSQTTGQWPWPRPAGNQSLSHTFRNFILGGYVKGKPVLITAQGTYGPMAIQAHNSDMQLRWEYKIRGETPGARGSHMCPVLDTNHDHIDELLWGERCIELDTGKELFCADRDTYRGHSDVIQPVLDRSSNKWFFFTCRESTNVSPRVALFNDAGRRIWGDVDQGHMDMGWVARIGENGEQIAMAIRIGAKTAGPKGFFRQEVDEFTYNALSGQPHPLPFSVFCTLPVDLNGDGIHELVRGLAEGNGDILDHKGRIIGNINGKAAIASKILDHPGEQILSFRPDGTICIWADRNAHDTPEALKRTSHPFYKANQKLSATGYNVVNLGGI